MAVNRPEDKGGLRYHKSLATVLYYYYISRLLSCTLYLYAALALAFCDRAHFAELTKIGRWCEVRQDERQWCDDLAALDQETKNYCAFVCVQLHCERANHQPVAVFHHSHLLDQ